jgi:transposase-like protein
MARETLEPDLAGLRERQWSKADARAVLDALARSGDSIRGFARAHDLDAHRIYYWRDRVGSETQLDAFDEPLSFTPVVVTGLGRAPALVLRLGELEIDVLDPQKVEPRWLAQLLAAAQGGG